MFEAVEPLSKKHCGFSEYVQLVSYFIMLASWTDLCRFVFRCQDDKDDGYLKKDQFMALLAVLQQNSPYNLKVWQLQWPGYHDLKLKLMFMKHFLSFAEHNPSVVWQAQLLQRKFADDNLGKKYWDAKAEQFRVIREELKVKRM